MTTEEVRDHCEKQIKMCEKWAKVKGEELGGKVYKEHKLILELLDHESILDKIRAEIIDTGAYEQEVHGKTEFLKGINYCLSVIDKYKESEE